MCGIAGLLRKDGRPIDREGLERIVLSLAHRGPDAISCRAYHQGAVGLGHTRLAIIDLSTGNQPMSSPDGQIGLVFNGEIYNYLELRERLVKEGVAFATESDTEVILKLYERDGERCVDLLRGMFAFAIYDAKKSRLLLARDRLGKKPLYYMERQNDFIFASEMKGILAYLQRPPDVDWSFLTDYLALGYIPQPATPFREIRKLQSGHRLILEGGNPKLERYWAVPPFSPESFTADAAEERLDVALREAVSIRLRSDVPFGALLSGGIDSSVVTALMVQSGNIAGAARTFSVGFDCADHNELPAAAVIARHLRTLHHEELLTIDAADVLPNIVWHMDEPFADSSTIPTWYVAAMAASQVKMVVSGDGGDELFCGYERYGRLAQVAALKKRRVLAALISIFGRMIPPQASGVPARLRRFAEYLREPPEVVYAHLVGIFGPDDIVAGTGVRSMFPPLPIAKAWPQGGHTILDKAMHTDIRTYLLEDVLVKVDRMSMAHSLEVRSPLLDQELLELTATIPVALKRPGVGKGKVILRQLAAELLPREIVGLPKRGFSAPIDNWYRKGSLRERFLDDLLAGRDVLNHFRPGFIQVLLGAVDRGIPAAGEKLFAIHTLLLWHRLFVSDFPGGMSSFDTCKGVRNVTWLGSQERLG